MFSVFSRLASLHRGAKCVDTVTGQSPDWKDPVHQLDCCIQKSCHHSPSDVLWQRGWFLRSALCRRPINSIKWFFCWFCSGSSSIWLQAMRASNSAASWTRAEFKVIVRLFTFRPLILMLWQIETNLFYCLLSLSFHFSCWNKRSRERFVILHELYCIHEFKNRILLLVFK